MLFSAGPSARASTYSPRMPLRAFLPHMPPMMRASTCAMHGQHAMQLSNRLQCYNNVTLGAMNRIMPQHQGLGSVTERANKVPTK
jgi:hypothetical protein